MDGANDLPQAEDSTMIGFRSSSVTSSEVEAQKKEQSRLAQSLKNYQSKSPEEAATILQQWNEVFEQYTQKKFEYKQLRREYTRLSKTMIFHQVNYVVNNKRIPSTINLGRLSTEHLQLLDQALHHENKAGEATWKIYEIQKKLCAIYDAAEEYITFREEHFDLEELEQQFLDEGKTAIAIGRSGCRRTGLKLMGMRQKMSELSEEIY